MSETSGLRWTQLKNNWRHGTQPWGQASDNTGVEGDLAAFNADGSVTDSGISSTGIVTTAGVGSWYGQVPRGTIDGSNTVFYLDYTLANPYTVLMRNGLGKKPAVDGPGANPNPEYSITGNVVTFTVAPLSTDWLYIWYFRNTPAPTPPSAVSAATVTVWTSYTGGVTEHAFAESIFSYAGGVNPTTIYSNDSFYSLQQNSLTLTLPTSPTTDSFSGATIEFALDGSLFSIDDPNYLNIYDAFITMTLAGGGLPVTIRPSSYAFTSGSSTGGLVTWLPDTTYAFGGEVIDGNGHIQLCTVTGTSGASEPAWADTGTTIDGSIIWTFVGPQTSVGGQIHNPTFAYDVDTAPPTTYAVFQESTWGGVFTGGNFTLVFGSGSGAITPTPPPPPVISGNSISFAGATSVPLPHNLNTLNLSPVVFDGSGNLIDYSTLQLVDANNALLTFATPQTGVLILSPTVYQQSFTSATSVSVLHNLGSMNIMPVVYDGSNNVIKFKSFVLDDTNSATLSFVDAQSGNIQIVAATGSYSQTFSSSTTVAVNHNLGSTQIRAAVYDDSNNMIEFNSFGPANTDTSTLTFAVSQSGFVAVALP